MVEQPPPDLLRAANERLVVAALRADTAAEAALDELQRLTLASQRDALTSLPNRALMRDRIDTAILTAQRHHTQLALLFVDLDHFKHINDTLGHAVGDEVLQLVARRIESVVRHSDTVSRHSGDEFLVLLCDVAQRAGVAGIAAKLLDALAGPGQIGAHLVNMSASVGIAIYPDDGNTADQLIMHADAAMYQAKRGGGDSSAFHGAAADAHALPVVRAQMRVGDSEPRAFSLGHGASLRLLRDANERLVIAALAAQEQQALIEEAATRQTAFLATLAHELRNPLAPISNAVHLIKLKGSGDEPVQAALAMIERQVTHLSRLVDDLLDVSRIRHGRIVLRKQRVELAQAARQALAVARPLMESMDQRWLVTVPLQPLYLDFDPVRLAQVLGNLLNNASKFTNRGGSLALTVERQPDWAVFRVADTGIGIAPGQIDRIFEMFAQADSSLERPLSGLGIGLALVKTLVEMHGGTVSVQSAGLGHGSEFTLTLPLFTEPPDLVPLPDLPVPAPLAPMRILVVDDNVDAALSLAEVLAFSGHTVQTAHDGMDGLDVAQSFLPDVVLLDIGLPHLNGYEVARRLRTLPHGQAVLLLALTGWGQPEDHARSAEAGFDAHLVKPLDFDALELLLRAPRRLA